MARASGRRALGLAGRINLAVLSILVLGLGLAAYFFAASLTSAAMGGITASYSLFGGTSPTSDTGETGTLSSLKATVDFAQQKITDYQMRIDFANRSFKASGGGISIAPTFNMSLSGDCQGCAAASPTQLVPVSGIANGAFIGPKAEGIVTSFGLHTQNADHAVSGVAIIKR